MNKTIEIFEDNANEDEYNKYIKIRNKKLINDLDKSLNYLRGLRNP